MEMQKIISELNENTTKNSHLEYLKREIESKNNTINNLESKLFSSALNQSSIPNTQRQGDTDKLKEVIEEEVKSLCDTLAQKVKDSMLPREKSYMHHLLENHESNEGSIESLLIKDKINQQVNFSMKSKEVHKLSHKIQMIFNTLKSIANNMEEASLEECLEKAYHVVMTHIDDIIKDDDDRMERLVMFVQENEDEKLSILKEKEEQEEYYREIEDQNKELEEQFKELEEQNKELEDYKNDLEEQRKDLQEENDQLQANNKEIEEVNKELDAKLLEATEELKNLYEKNPDFEQLEEEIEDLTNVVNNKDQQCQEMAEIIEHLEGIIEDEKQQNSDLNQNYEDLKQEIIDIKEELEEKEKIINSSEEEKAKLIIENTNLGEEKDKE